MEDLYTQSVHKTSMFVPSNNKSIGWEEKQKDTVATFNFSATTTRGKSIGCSQNFEKRWIIIVI